jgi:hypothetical protein
LPLDLQVVILGAGGDQIEYPRDEVRSLAQRVTVLSDIDPDVLGRGSWRETGLPSVLKHAVEQASPRPSLILRAGETVEIRDRRQVEGILAERTPAAYGEVGTGSGAEVRLLWPDTVTAAQPDQVVPIHALEISTKGAGRRRDWMPAVRSAAAAHALRKFIIAAPAYTEIHGGVVALHRLCDRLNAAGYEAYIHPTGPSSNVRPGWLTPLRRGRTFDDAVIIYPEVISGNPFTARRVVRWLLNRPAWFTGEDIDSGHGDLIVTFNHQIDPNVPMLEVPLIDPTIFFPKDVPGSGGLLWIGKGVLPPDFDRSNITLITNDWPATKPQLASLLRSASLLYSCDWLTSLLDESLMCGTPVVLIGEQSWSPQEVVLRPGMTTDESDGLDGARALVGSYYRTYTEGLGTTEIMIEQFVTLVNQHFGREVPTAAG